MDLLFSFTRLAQHSSLFFTVSSCKRPYNPDLPSTIEKSTIVDDGRSRIYQMLTVFHLQDLYSLEVEVGDPEVQNSKAGSPSTTPEGILQHWPASKDLSISWITS